jgi:hypothetical protein
VNEREWEGLAEGLASSAGVRAEMLRLGAELDPAGRAAFIHAVDSGAFPLGSWVEALALLRSWLEARGLELAAADRIGYVGCAAASAEDAAAFADLPELVRDFLEAHGCERARRKEPGGA